MKLAVPSKSNNINICLLNEGILIVSLSYHSIHNEGSPDMHRTKENSPQNSDFAKTCLSGLLNGQFLKAYKNKTKS